MTLRPLLLAVFMALPVAGWAQSNDQTLADIRQELTVLNVEIQKLKRELSTSGNAGGVTVGGSVLERMDQLEAEAQRLTARTEQMQNRINAIVADGTNRIGDLEFRLVELEGGDLSKLGETSTLGGEMPEGATAVATPPPATGGASTGGTSIDGMELAVAEKADFEAAKAMLDGGDAAGAITAFENFVKTYPGSPLQPLADLARGQALEQQGEITKAARAYLASFSAAPDGPVAASALFNLGKGLGQLGQTAEACTTLGEVANRFPGAPEVAEAQAQRATLGCS
ncbi:tol-pal system protein YbgF [Pseudooceanicola sp. C21-150M6]|uniref:tol-pal system protein YbgF n=1 Tax=Pseudooceanicola sp. C21-150M6 TaxID=3434355 RepID=UPI003D7F6F0E